MFTQSNVSLYIKSTLKNISQEVTGNQLMVATQSYLRMMGFPIGNFGPNHNGVDGQLGEATQAAWMVFQAIQRSEQPASDIETAILAQLEQSATNGSTFRSLASAASAKGVQILVSALILVF
jgi:hypothetical protein